jgi:hypothetical protein
MLLSPLEHLIATAPSVDAGMLQLKVSALRYSCKRQCVEINSLGMWEIFMNCDLIKFLLFCFLRSHNIALYFPSFRNDEL